MDDRLLGWLVKSAVKMKKQQQADMAVAVRVGFGADKGEFQEYIRELTDDTPREERVMETWDMLRRVGGG
jgi:hypothetical protein